MATQEPRPVVPRAFISYSWDDDAHKEWVKHLATRLRTDGVDVTLDRWHAAPGDQIPAFMERAVRENDFVIAVCTPRFKERSDARGGGVGYEGDIMTAFVFTSVADKKFIPVLRRGSWIEAAPTWLLGRANIDLSGEPYSESEYEELLRTLHGKREEAPPIGDRPNFGDRKDQTSRRVVEKAHRNRAAMIEKVRTIWITDFLQQSLFREVRIILGLSERPDAVARPLDLLVRRPDQGDRPLPHGTEVVDVFDSMDHSLLILGAPGAGKTTLLLELARNLLDRATNDPTHPIPVVFPLSTWAESRKPLVQWLADELNLRYDVPRKIAEGWVASDEVLPLLDGLDEVKAEHRGACLEAINAFRQSHGFLPLAIASRTADYEALAEPLRLYGAILVRSCPCQGPNGYHRVADGLLRRLGRVVHRGLSGHGLVPPPDRAPRARLFPPGRAGSRQDAPGLATRGSGRPCRSAPVRVAVPSRAG
jgi:hypothetical protein